MAGSITTRLCTVIKQLVRKKQRKRYYFLPSESHPHLKVASIHSLIDRIRKIYCLSFLNREGFP